MDNNKRLGIFTVEAFKIIQPVNPTIAASTGGSTSTVCTSSQKGDLTVEKGTLGKLYNHDVDDDKNVKIIIAKVFINNMNKNTFFFTYA